MKRETYIIDATDKILGRLATRVAMLLRGKHKPHFLPYKDMGDFVVVENIDKIKFTAKKLDKKVYYHHTGFLGGLKSITLRKLFAKNPEKVLKKAVYGMLPANKLRAKQIKRLKIHPVK